MEHKLMGFRYNFGRLISPFHESNEKQASDTTSVDLSLISIFPRNAMKRNEKEATPWKAMERNGTQIDGSTYVVP